MKVSDKIKQIFELFNLNLDETAKYLGITTQSLRNKFNRDSFSIRDLIIISHLCDGDLNIKFIIHDEIEPISFDYDILSKDDIDRIENLDYEKAKNSIASLGTWLPKLSPEEQEKIINELEFLRKHMTPSDSSSNK